MQRCLLPCLAAAFVVFHHGKFLGHIKADEVFIGGEAAFVFAVDNFINGKVQSLLEAVFADPVFNLVRKLLLGFQEFPQITGVDRGDFVSVQSDSGCFDEFRCHACSFHGFSFYFDFSFLGIRQTSWSVNRCVDLRVSQPSQCGGTEGQIAERQLPASTRLTFKPLLRPFAAFIFGKPFRWRPFLASGTVGRRFTWHESAVPWNNSFGMQAIFFS